MGLCNKRFFLLTLCTIQLITTVERQVFDFLGFMWVPILVNFFNIIFVILGFFGAFQYQPKYIVSYCIWNALWLVWNIFVTCFYLSVGVLDKNSDLLNLGTGSFSWWQVNGPGCRAHYNDTVSDRLDVERPDLVTGCILDYEIIEVLHSSAQCLLAVMAVIGGIMLSRVFMEEDDSSTIRKKKQTQLRPLYSIEYSQPEPPSVHQDDRVSPKPMTPRRVKRRSVISRDGMRRSSRRSSVRQSRRKHPMNRIMDHQEGLYANTPAVVNNLSNQNANTLSQGMLNYDRISGRWERVRINTNPSWPQPNNQNWPQHNNPSWPQNNNQNWPPPNNNMNMNMNMAASTSNIWQQDATSYPSLNQNNWENASSTRNLTENMGQPINQMQWQGQCNPSFQQTSTQSLNAEDMDEIYIHRPPSARSTYSNFHGVRATPQVPARSDHVRQSQRQFVLSGPPAYQDTVI